MKRMKFNVAHAALLRGEKTVTRRIGWGDLEPGTKLEAVREVKRAGVVEIVVLGIVTVVSVRSEPLSSITPEECAREGYPNMRPREFVNLFCRVNARSAFAADRLTVTRVEFTFEPATAPTP